MALSKALRAEILALPREQKDKLLLRLIGRNDLLEQQLTFELREHGASAPERREAIRQGIDRLYRSHHESAGYLMMAMRPHHAEIVRHVKITKDKYGEVELVLYLLNQCFEQQFRFVEWHSRKTDSLAEYLAKRTESVWKKYRVLHPDLQFEFQAPLDALLARVHRHASGMYARKLGLPTGTTGS